MQLDQIKRRDFITLLGGAAVAWPLAARAQQPERTRWISVVIPPAENDPEGRGWVAAFREGLEKLGWTDGHNIRIETRWGVADASSMQRNAKELVALQPDVILTNNTPTVRSLLQETHTIPIVFVNLVDPVSSGVVASLARPGGNATGFTIMEGSMAGKWLDPISDTDSPILTHCTVLARRRRIPHGRRGRWLGKKVMKRRVFISLIGGAAMAWPLTARAQRPAIPVIGFLRSTSPDGTEHLLAAFRRGLKETGHVEGQNMATEYRWAEGDVNRLSGLAAELVRRDVAVIVANGVAANAAKAATATIPIVFVIGIDPVRSGLVASLNRPGGNVTGISILAGDLDAKRIEVLHEMVPNASIIAVLLDPNVVETAVEAQAVQHAAQSIGLRAVIVRA